MFWALFGFPGLSTRPGGRQRAARDEHQSWPRSGHASPAWSAGCLGRWADKTTNRFEAVMGIS
eukprot:388034-Pyramimonas_sp.AAC.1